MQLIQETINFAKSKKKQDYATKNTRQITGNRYSEKENIFVMDDTRAHTQDIRPLKIVILNLMPLKITTETDLIRLLSNTPLQIDITFMKLKSHTPKNTPIEHMMMFYKDFDEIKEQKYDGMIITGAPVETYDYEDVGYWNEITKIFDWAKSHITSTLYICWAAQAGLYHHYGIPKYGLKKRCSEYSSNIALTPSCLFSEDSTTSSLCHTADIQKLEKRIY